MLTGVSMILMQRREVVMRLAYRGLMKIVAMPRVGQKQDGRQVTRPEEVLTGHHSYKATGI